MYLAGFPCKAFSRLRESTEGLQDPEAQQFHEIVAVVKEIHPKVPVVSLPDGFSLTRFSLDDTPGECAGHLRIPA